MIRRTFVTFAAALLAVMLLGTNDARAFLIDGFGDDQLNVINLTGDGPDDTCGSGTEGECSSDNFTGAALLALTTTVTDTDLSGVVTRTISATITDDDSLISGFGTILTSSVAVGSYFFSTAVNVIGDGWIDWTFGTLQDFTVFSSLNVILEFLTLDHSGVVLTLEVCDGGDCSSDSSGGLLSGPQLVAFDIGDLCSGFGGGGDCLEISTMSLHITGVSNLQIKLDMIGIIPEPATLALFGIGLLGLGFLSRRRKRFAA